MVVTKIQLPFLHKQSLVVSGISEFWKSCFTISASFFLCFYGRQNFQWFTLHHFCLYCWFSYFNIHIFLTSEISTGSLSNLSVLVRFCLFCFIISCLSFITFCCYFQGPKHAVFWNSPSDYSTFLSGMYSSSDCWFRGPLSYLAY